VERGEIQKQDYPSFHDSLGISQKGARFPHSHSSDDNGAWGSKTQSKARTPEGVGRVKGEIQKAGFPLFHRPDSLRQQGGKPHLKKNVTTSGAPKTGTLLSR
jgi:hypothetical protein